MILPEKVLDNNAKTKIFMESCDGIRVVFGMTTNEELYLIGRIFEIIKFEMIESDKVESGKNDNNL